MSIVTTIHGQMSVVDDEGNVQILHQETSGSDVKITTDNTNVSSNLITVQKLIDKLGKLAFKDEIETTNLAMNSIANNTDTVTAGKLLDARVGKELSDRVKKLESDFTIIYDDMNDLEENMPESEINDNVTSTGLTWSSKKLSDHIARLHVRASDNEDKINDETLNRTRSDNTIQNDLSSLKSTVASMQQSVLSGTNLTGYAEEVAGLRSGYYGDSKSYTSAGEAVKAQIKTIKQGVAQTTLVGTGSELKVGNTTQLPGTVGIDSTLAIEGFAAEAKSVGDKLAKCGSGLVAKSDGKVINLEMQGLNGEVVDTAAFEIPQVQSFLYNYDPVAKKVTLDIDKQVVSVDDTLIVTGKAADAGATGKAIQNVQKQIDTLNESRASIIDNLNDTLAEMDQNSNNKIDDCNNKIDDCNNKIDDCNKTIDGFRYIASVSAKNGTYLLNSSNVYLFIIRHASTANGNGMCIYIPSNGNIFWIKQASDVTIKKDGNNVNFTCAYGPMVNIISIS